MLSLLIRLMLKSPRMYASCESIVLLFCNGRIFPHFLKKNGTESQPQYSYKLYSYKKIECIYVN